MTKDALLHYLKSNHTGRQRAIRSQVLEPLFGVYDSKFRRLINELRKDGEPICSDENGYYYAATQTELTGTIKQLSSRISNMSKARNGLNRAMALLPDESGQTSIPL